MKGAPVVVGSPRKDSCKGEGRWDINGRPVGHKERDKERHAWISKAKNGREGDKERRV